ncbi:hypothetical protein [Puerhibacterium puerhi]|uniref:hypothetical protein n=1 Tax=Puerhibacterium puerhi TaxID=2692623 RepID=UPI001356DDAD|nr:hypothetical protein [Puerhibacterium puerhi]
MSVPSPAPAYPRALPRALAAAVAGVATTAYYATPDFIAGRTARGWAKAGLSVAILAASVPDFVAARAATRAEAQARVAAWGAGPAQDAEVEASEGSLVDLDADPADDLPDNTLAPTADDALARMAEQADELPGRAKAVIAGLGAGALLGSVALTVAAERWVFRRGEARAAAGKRWPHTAPAVLYGALAAAVALLPDDVGTPAAGTTSGRESGPAAR